MLFTPSRSVVLDSPTTPDRTFRRQNSLLRAMQQGIFTLLVLLFATIAAILSHHY